jgi:heme/copper-type cytochrome/quinol oxidase subunit 3
MDPAARHPASVPGDRPLELCRMYWTFVAVLWIALFGLVYLA